MSDSIYNPGGVVTHSLDDQLADKQRRIDALVVTINQLRDEADRVKAECQTKLDNQAADWKKLNELLNKYADDENYCEGYEERLDEWNKKFEVFTLVGRRKAFVVTTKITMEFVNEIEVDAIDMDAAKEKVDEMDTADILSGVEFADYADVEWESTHAREGYL